MENHPIPQDVTGFKFKLIGSITVKQFLYLLGFGILTTVAFVLNINFLLRIPLMLFFAGIGASLAFLPIEGRPLDTMIVNFAKTIPAENRYIFRKRGANLSSFEVLQIPAKQIVASSAITQTTQQKTKTESDDKRAILISRLRNSTFRPDEGEAKILNNIHALFENSGSRPVISADPVLKPDVSEEEAKNALDEKLYRLEKEAQEEHAEEHAVKPEAPPASPVSTTAEEPAPKDNIIVSSEENTHEALAETAPIPPMPEKPNPNLSAGFPTLPDIGNVVLGIVRDPRGRTLQNILVEVVDTNNIPVRAFKTNALGQFAAATPLSNGSYLLRFEDPTGKHEFQIIQINLGGEIFEPLEIVSVDAREKLRQELFGNVAAA